MIDRDEEAEAHVTAIAQEERSSNGNGKLKTHMGQHGLFAFRSIALGVLGSRHQRCAAAFDVCGLGDFGRQAYVSEASAKELFPLGKHSAMALIAGEFATVGMQLGNFESSANSNGDHGAPDVTG